MPHVPDTVPGKRVTDAGARTEGRGQPSNIRGGSRMQESCPYGSVRGAPSNGCPYRDLFAVAVSHAPVWIEIADGGASERTRARRRRVAEA